MKVLHIFSETFHNLTSVQIFRLTLKSSLFPMQNTYYFYQHANDRVFGLRALKKLKQTLSIAV